MVAWAEVCLDLYILNLSGHRGVGLRLKPLLFGSDGGATWVSLTNQGCAIRGRLARSLRVKEDIDAGRECLIKGLCIYLNEDPEDLVKEYMDMTEANTLREVEGTTVGIYVARETPSNDYSDVGVILEGVVVLHDLENVALAAAMLFGLMYGLNMNYPSKLRYTLEVIQKVIMELDASDLSRKAQNLKRKMQE
ncbi:hypothetical protein NQZ68_029799 [Dissostichus eleginoides]|nr:hypothetical protein NQZ68_029799 [Dissostichus eleginoides]